MAKIEESLAGQVKVRRVDRQTFLADDDFGETLAYAVRGHLQPERSGTVLTLRSGGLRLLRRDKWVFAAALGVYTVACLHLQPTLGTALFWLLAGILGPGLRHLHLRSQRRQRFNRVARRIRTAIAEYLPEADAAPYRALEDPAKKP